MQEANKRFINFNLITKFHVTQNDSLNRLFSISPLSRICVPSFSDGVI